MSQRNNTNLISISALIAIIFLMLMTQACTKKSSPPPAPTDQDAQGLFTTNTSKNTVTATFANPTVVEPLNAIKGMVYGVLPNQKFIFFDVASNVLYDGVISAIALTDVTGTATVYHDGVMVSANIAVTGTVTSSSTISLTFATKGDFTAGTIEGLYNSSYDQVATKDRIKAVVVDKWRSAGSGALKMAIALMDTSNFSIPFIADNSYSYFSSTPTITSRCDHNGTLTIDTPKNIYTLLGESITATTNCTITNSPVYKGFASVITVDGAGKGTEMWYATTNGTNSIFAILVRP